MIPNNDLVTIYISCFEFKLGALNTKFVAPTAALIAREGAPERIEQVITFGAPRVGKLKVLKRPITQYRFQNDIVPTVPWPLSRPGPLSPLGKQKTRGNWISDHSIINYVNALWAR